MRGYFNAGAAGPAAGICAGIPPVLTQGCQQMSVIFTASP
jgi:hypothetical protein